jgi:hypothetical protein
MNQRKACFGCFALVRLPCCDHHRTALAVCIVTSCFRYIYTVESCKYSAWLFSFLATLAYLSRAFSEINHGNNELVPETRLQGYDSLLQQDRDPSPPPPNREAAVLKRVENRATAKDISYSSTISLKPSGNVDSGLMAQVAAEIIYPSFFLPAHLERHWGCDNRTCPTCCCTF